MGPNRLNVGTAIVSIYYAIPESNFDFAFFNAALASAKEEPLSIPRESTNPWALLIARLILGIFGVGPAKGKSGIGGATSLTLLTAFWIAWVLGTSVSGALTHWFRKTLDYKMGLVIVSGGILGTFVGMLIPYFAYTF